MIYIYVDVSHVVGWEDRPKCPGPSSHKYRRVAAFITLFVRKFETKRIVLHEPGLHFVYPALVNGAKALEQEDSSRCRVSSHVANLEGDRSVNIVSNLLLSGRSFLSIALFATCKSLCTGRDPCLVTPWPVRCMYVCIVRGGVSHR
jgi:hypothetical protein